MRVAIIGLRGVPAKYSGVENSVEQVSKRIVAAGHSVTVFCMAARYSDHPDQYLGIDLVYVQTISSKNLEMIFYSFLSTIKALLGRYDVIHFHALGPSVMSVFSWLFRRPSVATCHGLDYSREKWGFPARAYLRLGEYASARFASKLIVVSDGLRRHFIDRYGNDAHAIPNGAAKVERLSLSEIGQRYGLEPNGYILFVGRLVECKRVELLVHAFQQSSTSLKLAIVGEGPENVVGPIRTLAKGDPRIVMTGALFGEDLGRIFSNAAGFVLPSVLEGLPIALIEALSYDLPVIVSNIPENVEVVRDAPLGCVTLVEPDSLDSLRRALDYADGSWGLHERGCIERFVLSKFDWDDVTDQTLAVYNAALNRTGL